ncbi:unnamed protein product [Blepharisma stoltei]|uniref:Uncharacterized protein n=1 Tax=Blepharisma stoltei TaxID=1481888 RepID=A0AAU9JR23_9CILI|nr:unnamed protein product [Blepharisma stoltei]
MMELKLEMPRSYNLHMPISLAMQRKPSVQIPSPKKAVQDEYRRFSEQIKLPPLTKTRPRIESCNACIGSSSEYLGNHKSGRTLKYLPYIYAQSGFDGVNRMLTDLKKELDDSPGIERKAGLVNILEDIRPKERELHRSKTFNSLR